MISNQILQSTIDGLKVISRIDLSVMDLEGNVLAATYPEAEEHHASVLSFVDSPADSQVSTTSNGSWIIIPSSWKASIPTFQRNYREKPPGRATYSSCRAFMRATAFSWPD